MSERDQPTADDGTRERAPGVNQHARAVNEHARAVNKPPTCVVITGFMAAGKTTVSRALARLLGCGMFDTDELVRAREGRTPAEIIEADGEPRFRELESHALRDALAHTGALVVATGGGTLTGPANRALVAERGCLTVWLDAPFELCWQRLEDESLNISRPLARDRETARALYDARRVSYALATLRVAVSGGDAPEEIAERIARSLPTHDA